MGELPQWEQGTPALLCVAGHHAIPISTAVRLDGRRLAFGLGRRRETLTRLRADPGASISILARGLAFTAHGQARVVREELEASTGVVGLELIVDRVHDHLADGRTEMLSGAEWRWNDERAAAEAPAILEELAGF